MTRLVLLMGNENYLIEQKLSELCKGLSNPGLNLEHLDVETTGENDIIERLYQIPFIDENRIIVIHGDVFSKNFNKLAKYCSHPDSDTTMLIFCVTKEDRRSKLFKAIHDNGLVLTMNHLKEKQLIEFTKTYFQENGLTLSDDLASYICHRSGYLLSEDASLQTLVQSFQNIILSGRSISEETINAYVKPFLNTNVFSLTHCIGTGNIKKTLLSLNDLLESGVDEFQLLALIRRHYRILYKLVSGISPEDIGLSPFMLGEFKEERGKTTHEKASEYLNTIQTMYNCIRRGQVAPRLGIETLLVQLALKGGSL